MALNRVFGSNVKELRVASDQSQAELGRKSSLARSYLCKIENGTGNPSLDVVERLATALEVDPLFLLVERGCHHSKSNLSLKLLTYLISEGYQGDALRKTYISLLPVARRLLSEGLLND